MFNAFNTINKLLAQITEYKKKATTYTDENSCPGFGQSLSGNTWRVPKR